MVHISNALLAGMSPLSKGGGGTASSEIQGSETRGDVTEPIISLAETQFFNPEIRPGGAPSWDKLQAHTKGQASAKKRKANAGSAIGITEDVFAQAFERAGASGRLRELTGPTPATGSLGEIQFLRGEITLEMSKMHMQLTQLVKSTMAEMQAEADRRVEATLQRVMEMLEMGPKQNDGRMASKVRTDPQSESATQSPVEQTQRPGQTAQPSWANVVGAGTENGWTKVVNGKRKPKKHPHGQRRVLLFRNVRSHSCDPRDTMFEVNKTLAHARAHVTIRLIKMGYTDKGNLTGVLSENACANELLNYAPVVMGAVRKLDPEVAYMEKTEKWLKLRVHGVALDRYMTQGGLDVAREEIELMTGELRWRR